MPYMMRVYHTWDGDMYTFATIIGILPETVESVIDSMLEEFKIKPVHSVTIAGTCDSNQVDRTSLFPPHYLKFACIF